MTAPTPLRSPRHARGLRPPNQQPRRVEPAPKPQPLQAGDLLSTRAVEAILGLSNDTVHRLIRKGHLGEPVYSGRVVQVRRADLEAYVARGGTRQI